MVTGIRYLYPMAKKASDYQVTRVEEVPLNFYAVRSRDGKWLRAKGYGGSGESWVDDIHKAKIYGNPAPAKAQITFWARNYPQFGVPDLVRISTGRCEYLDQESRVQETVAKLELEKARREVRNLERWVRHYSDAGYRKNQELARFEAQLAAAQANLAKLTNR